MIDVIDLRNRLDSKEWHKEPFRTIADISALTSTAPNYGREFVIRALEHRQFLAEEYRHVLDELVVAVGLHPYVEDLRALSLRSSFVHATHLAEGSLPGYVLHSSQAKVLRYLLSGDSIILSAPTSYGKSLLIDLAIAARNFDNVALIVPTLALVEETRRRMSAFSDRYSIITGAGQTFGEKNIFVLTQERYLALESEMPNIDFFAIDEFYKLSISEDGDRATQLNQALLRLLRTGAQFYMLGPSIRNIPPIATEKLNCRFLIEDFHTVAIELHSVRRKPNKIAALANLLRDIPGQTMVYCQSPASTRKLLKGYLEIENVPETDDEELLEASDWTAENYHQEWLVSLGLRHGIGIHHGRLPRALGRFMIRAFEQNQIRMLLCTSTLIEGVNTVAQNVVVYDSKLNRKPLDFFTFNNIRGRSGRMFRHFIGHVYVFDPPPEEELPFVDMPAVNPTRNTPGSLLVQMDRESLPEELKERFDVLTSHPIVSRETLRKLSGIEPEYLIKTADYFLGLDITELRRFSWSRRPEYDDIRRTSEIIWNQLGGMTAARQSAMRTASMMTFWIWELYKARRVSVFKQKMIASQIGRGIGPDEAVEDVLAFLRGWASFNYPKYLAALSDVATLVLAHRGQPSCNYMYFAVAIEHLFQPTSFSTLEEYGLPAELAERMVAERVFDATDGIDEVMTSLRSQDLPARGRGLFEKRLLEDFQSGIGLKREIAG